jgi:hypothetical protein
MAVRALARASQTAFAKLNLPSISSPQLVDLEAREIVSNRLNDVDEVPGEDGLPEQVAEGEEDGVGFEQVEDDPELGFEEPVLSIADRYVYRMSNAGLG